jgi:dsRNA-specific ribonuclease
MYATQDEIAIKVRRILEASQNISLLQEYCQKTQRPLPEWTPFSTPGSSMAGYSHGMQLLIDGQRFECQGASTRQEAKKSCATAAVEFFEKQGVPYFLKREHNYISLLHQLTQAASIPNPVFQAEGTIAFMCYVSVNGDKFQSRYSHTRKNLAKEDAAKVAFEALCQEPSIVNTIFLMRPSYVTQVKKIDAATVKREDSNFC